MITIVGCNKGGAAKTTTAVNLTIGLAMAGCDVCLLDADPQRSSAKFMADREAMGFQCNFAVMEKRGNITSTLLALGKKFEQVIVDVQGRNSEELITGAMACNLIIAPHQCSKFDLETLFELQEQVIKIRQIVNPSLRVQVYHAMASTHVKVKDKERAQFLEYLAEFPEFEVLKSISYHRKIYKDAADELKSVLELKKNDAADEVRSLLKEVYNYA